MQREQSEQVGRQREAGMALAIKDRRWLSTATGEARHESNKQVASSVRLP